MQSCPYRSSRLYRVRLTRFGTAVTTALLGTVVALVVVTTAAVTTAGATTVGQAVGTPVSSTSTTGQVSARPSAGCASSASSTTSTTVTPAGGQSIPLSAGGDTGSYFLQLPTSYNGKTPMPVVIDLHGYDESAGLQVSISALGQYGNSHGFIVVTPGVQETVSLWDTTLGSKDLAFFGGLLDNIESTLCVDQNRVFVTGYSDGAFMSSAIACQYAGRVAAVAPVAGIQAISGCHPSRPVPVVAFHGTADPYVPYTGGIGKAAEALPAPNGVGTLGQTSQGKAQKKGPSIPAQTATWARRNGCQPSPTYTKVASDVTLIRYSCPHGADVELYRVTGGGHAWPGSEGTAAIAAVVGRTTFSISADSIMWKFFQSHPLTKAS